MGREIRLPSRMKTASISTRKATRPTASNRTARSTGIRIPDFAATIPNATSAMARTAWALPMRRRSADSLKTQSYNDFLGVVAGGKKDVNTAQDLVMPSFGLNKNVMCYIDDILCLSAGARQRCRRSRAARETRRKTRSRHEVGGFLHGREPLKGGRYGKSDRIPLAGVLRPRVAR